MPISQTGLVFFLLSVQALASNPQRFQSSDLHFSADRQIWDRKNQQVELIGHAAVHQSEETLTADWIFLDLKTRFLKARGHCVYAFQETVVFGEQMELHLETRQGTVHQGRIVNERLTLQAEKIEKRESGHFLTQQAEYTTCHDCEASWSFQGDSMDLTFGNYAYFSNVIAKIKGVPLFWLPYWIMPVKTDRQTGLLFPKMFSDSWNGFSYVFPWFLTLGRSADMTFGLGEYTKRGLRMEWEGRYALTDRNRAQANVFFVRDQQFLLPRVTSRWALDVHQSHELFWGIQEKLRFSELSDNLYPFHFSSDMKRLIGEANVSSDLIFSKATSGSLLYLQFKRTRYLLNATPHQPQAQLIDFDPKTVQLAPRLGWWMKDHVLKTLPGVIDFHLQLSHFTRGVDFFDQDSATSPLTPGESTYQPGWDPLRKAVRLSWQPRWYATYRPWDRVSVVPSFQYRSYLYHFGYGIPSLYRGYVLFQTDLRTQLEKVYEFQPEDPVQKGKHLIRPLLTYSYIPSLGFQRASSHPFVQQIEQTHQKTYIPGYYFDTQDQVPYTYTATTANYLVPLGHSLAYGFSTQWIRRYRHAESLPMVPVFEWNVGQAINFLEMTQPLSPRHPHVFTRLFSNVNLKYPQFVSETTYYYYPDVYPSNHRHTITTANTYLIEDSLHQKILTFRRSITLGYTLNYINSKTSNLWTLIDFSLSDYLLPSAHVSYSFEPQPSLMFAGLSLTLQNPSRCWKMILGSQYASGRQGLVYTFDLSLNLSGKGFEGLGNVGSRG